MKKIKEKKMFNEFKKFINRGNVVDLAVGVVVGAAFGKIVSSLVNDVIMPLIGLIIGGIDFTSLSFKVKDATISYGMFLQNIIDFLIISFCVFLFVKFINKINHKEEDKPKKDAQLVVLESIRDELKRANKK